MKTQRIKEVFETAGFPLAEEDCRRFALYMELLEKWNRVHNLTAVRDEEGIVKRHFLDSLRVKLCFDKLGIDWEGKDVADVGSGAGFPGVPLKIVLKDFNLFLIESTAKKCSFLEVLKVNLGLEWEVICDRAENVSRKFDIVLARALGELEEIHELLENLSRGLVFIIKGKELKENWIKDLGYEALKTSIKGLPDIYVLYKRIF